MDVPIHHITDVRTGDGVIVPIRVVVFWDEGFVSHALPETGSLTIGRAIGCDVQVEHPSVSRRHAILHLGPTLAIEDCGSSNGISIAGRRLPPGVPTELPPGQAVEIGGVMLVVQSGSRTIARPSAASPTGEYPTIPPQAPPA